MVFAVARMVRSGFDVKDALSQKTKVTHRLDVTMEFLSRDLSGAFIVSSRDTLRDGGKKRTLFRLSKGESDTLAFTYVGHRPIRENAKESDISYVIYEVRESKKNPGRKHLYRGESPRVPRDFKEDVPMSVLAEDIAELHVEPWNGENFSSDGWDSTNSDTRDLLPRLVRVRVLAWEEEPDLRLGKEVKPTVQYSTVIYLPFALDYKEPKTGVSTFSLFK